MGEVSSVAVSCGVGCGHGSDLVLLWLWCGQAATAPIRPLAWEKKKKKKKKEERKGLLNPTSH